MTTEERVEKLEKDLARVASALVHRTADGRVGRGLLVICVAIACVLAGALAPARTRAQAAGGKVVRATGFVLVDEKGRTRASLLVTEDGPGLLLQDEKGETRFFLHVGELGPGLTLFDEKGEGRAFLDVLKRVPGLTLFDEMGKGRALLSVWEDGPELSLYDEKGEEIWSTP